MNKNVRRLLVASCALGFGWVSPQVAFAHEEEPIPFPAETMPVEEPAVSTNQGDSGYDKDGDTKMLAVVIAGLAGAAAVAGSALIVSRKRVSIGANNGETSTGDAEKNE